MSDHNTVPLMSPDEGVPLDAHVRLEHLVSDIRLRVSLGEFEEAVARVRNRSADIGRNVWACTIVVKLLAPTAIARDVLRPLFESLDNKWEEVPEDDRTSIKFSYIMAFGCEFGTENRPAYLDTEADLVRYMRLNGFDESMEIASLLLDPARFRDVHDIAGMLHAALDTGTGFSVVRVGDGEGRFVPGLTQYPDLYADSVRTAQRIWFWNSRTFPDDGYFARLAEAFLCADVVGFNPPFRVAMESRGSYLGYIGVTNGNRFLQTNLQGAGFKLAHNWINVSLERSGELAALVQKAARVTVISPHEDIGSNKQIFGGKEIFHWRIPSENHRLVVNTSMKEPHYPDMFERILGQIGSANPGLVLVAGGIFGKLYCHEVKKAGGVAIDVGSLADEWMGLKTR